MNSNPPVYMQAHILRMRDVCIETHIANSLREIVAAPDTVAGLSLIEAAMARGDEMWHQDLIDIYGKLKADAIYDEMHRTNFDE